jgi:hypothetical protein
MIANPTFRLFTAGRWISYHLVLSTKHAQLAFSVVSDWLDGLSATSTFPRLLVSTVHQAATNLLIGQVYRPWTSTTYFASKRPDERTSSSMTLWPTIPQHDGQRGCQGKLKPWQVE